jgi:hypothetical protein
MASTEKVLDLFREEMGKVVVENIILKAELEESRQEVVGLRDALNRAVASGEDVSTQAD